MSCETTELTRALQLWSKPCEVLLPTSLSNDTLVFSWQSVVADAHGGTRSTADNSTFLFGQSVGSKDLQQWAYLSQMQLVLSTNWGNLFPPETLSPSRVSFDTVACGADTVVVSCKTWHYVPVDYWKWSWSALSTEFCLRKLQTMFAVWKALIHVSTFICSMQIVRELCLFTWLPVDRSLVVRGRLRAPRQRVRCTTGQIFHASPESLWRYC